MLFFPDLRAGSAWIAAIGVRDACLSRRAVVVS